MSRNNNRMITAKLTAARGQFCRMSRRHVLVRALVYVLVAVPLLVALDYLIAMPVWMRCALIGGLWLALFIWVLVNFFRISRVRVSDIARMMDRDDPRGSILSAYELENEQGLFGDSDMQKQLGGCLIRDAWLGLNKLGRHVWLPLELERKLRHYATGAGVFCLVALFLALPVTKVVLPRVLFPWSDTPPYSPLSFAITPDELQVIYGDDLELSAAITGGEIRDQVWFLIRSGEKVQQQSTFHEGGGRFSQKMENVIEPVEVAFKTGRARSEWYPVKVLLEPRVASARVHISPPEYMGLPARAFYLGKQQLAVPEGTVVRLDVSSNRPLSSSEMTIRADEDSKVIERVSSERVDAFTQRFEWQPAGNRVLSVDLVDQLGTRSREPLLIAQAVTPDRPPEVSITEPALVAVATPKATVQLSGYAEDDYGLHSADFMRTVLGYTDRGASLPVLKDSKRIQLYKTWDLSKLGVEPGDVLEAYLEARDHNPNLLGVASSPVVRVQIISEDMYAEMLRSRESIRSFAEKMAQADAAVNELREQLNELSQIIESGSPEEIEKALAEAREAFKNAQEKFKELSEDFPIYDSEEEAQKVLERWQDMLQRTGDEVASWNSDTEYLAKMAEDMAELFRRDQEQSITKEKEKAEELAEVEKLLETAMRFYHVYQAQKDLVQRFRRFRDRTEPSEVALLAFLGATQESMKQETEAIIKDIRTACDELDGVKEYAQFVSGARELADKAEELEITTYMQQASYHAGQESGGNAYTNAEEALMRIEQLFSQCNSGYCNLAQGGRSLTLQHPDAWRQSTIEQMMAGLCQRFGIGQGRGSGFGGGAGGSVAGGSGSFSSGGGYSAFSPMNVPVFGPERNMSPDVASGNGGRGKAGDGQGDGSERIIADGGELPVSESPDSERESSKFENSPPRYREALQQYYSPQTTTEP